MKDQETTIATLRQLMGGFVNERQWQKFHTPKNITAALAVEASELLELYQWATPEEAITRSQEDPAFRQAVSEEMADVMMYLLSLANSLDLDLAAAVENKMIKNKKKYPADKYQGHYQRPLPQ
jgi:NTP pyrophosphatase (non-canonical NTP hydrolase)